MAKSATESKAVVDWMRVLGRIEETLEHSLARANEIPPQISASAEQSASPLTQLDERLERWQACLARAERNAADAEETLASEAQGVEAWIQSLRETREKRIPGGQSGS